MTYNNLIIRVMLVKILRKSRSSFLREALLELKYLWVNSYHMTVDCNSYTSRCNDTL